MQRAHRIKHIKILTEELNTDGKSNKLIIIQQTALALELGREQELVCAVAALQDPNTPFYSTNTPVINHTVSHILHLSCEGQG